MPLHHSKTFQVRMYECDPYGHLNNLNYLRLMQEAALEASAAAGYDQNRYEVMGRHWVTHRTEINYLSPIRFGDCVEINTWLTDFRRVGCRRAYELRLAGTDSVVAKAHTGWVFVDSQTGKPVPIPVELLEAFFPEGLPETAAPHPPFPTPLPPPPGIYRSQRQVQWRDLDSMLHVNNASYLAYIEDCGIQVAVAHGWPLSRMWDDGFGIIVRQHRIEYFEPAVLGDELEVATWVSVFKRATALRHFIVTRLSDGTAIANVHTWWVWVDNETGRPIRVPPHFIADFEPNLSRGE